MIKDTYELLRQHLDEKTIGFPSTKSGVEMRILKHLFTEEEASIALHLDFAWHDLEPLEKIYDRAEILGHTLDELKKHLDNMAQKGAIMAHTCSEKSTYGLANFIIGMSDYQMDKWTKEFYLDCTKYLHEAYIKKTSKISLTQTRFIPVNQEIEPINGILSHDNLSELLEKVEGPFCIANCVCRQGKDLLNDPCKLTDRRDICISFGLAAERYIEKEWAREVSKEEALLTLKKNAEDGLIHQISNTRKLDFICSCCKCCCEAIKLYDKIPFPGLFINCNYYAQVDPKECSGCKTCLERCQIGAIKIEKNVASVKKRRCIGCGNCISSCPSNAMKLVKKKKIKEEPLDNGQVLYQEILKLKKKE